MMEVMVYRRCCCWSTGVAVDQGGCVLLVSLLLSEKSGGTCLLGQGDGSKETSVGSSNTCSSSSKRVFFFLSRLAKVVIGW